MTKLNKQLVFLAFIFLLVLAFSYWTTHNAYALSTETITISWDKEIVETDLAGFELRINKDNSTIIDIPGANVREWSGAVILQDGNNTLNIRAKDLAGQVSEWSEPCYYDPIPGVPSKATVIVKVTIIVN